MDAYPPAIPAELRRLMAEVGPVWGNDTRGHIRLMLEKFSDILVSAPKSHAEVRHDISYGDNSWQKLDVFLPRDSHRQRAAIIFVHGGAFTEGDRNRTSEIYSNVLYYFSRFGIVGVNVGYRLAPAATFPATTVDLAAAVAWTQRSADKLGISTQRIFLMGHSAGAAHTGSYAYDPRFRPSGGTGLAGHIVVSGRVRIDALPENPNAARVKAYYGDDPTVFESVSPVALVDTDSIPTLIAYAEFENPLVDVYCLELAWRLAAVQRRAPGVIWLPGHNHTSSIAHFNTEEDALGVAIRAFVANVDGMCQ